MSDEKIAVKKVHGIQVYVDPDTGTFSATFSQGSENKVFERPQLQPLEQLITQHTFPFSGHVEVGTAPHSLVPSHQLRDLEESLTEDETPGRYRRHGLIKEQRDIRVLTGVQRLTRDRYPSALVFRTDTGSSVDFADNWVHPNPELDAEYKRLAEEYLVNQKSWDEAFQKVRQAYVEFTSQEIVAELKKQGARTGRA